MTLTLPKLPYELDALAPHISKETLEYHHLKHHQAYVTNGNKLIDGTKYENMSEEEIMKDTANQTDKAGIFNNVSQIWNHTFYFKSMKANGGGNPSSNLTDLLNNNFGSVENFKEQFATAGATQFGSGWVWLVKNADKLEIIKTGNAANPITDGKKPLLAMDVWEHAYYIDFRNARPKYIDVFLNNLINWNFIEDNL